MVMSLNKVKERLYLVRNSYRELEEDRQRIRAIIDGGPDGLRALLGPKLKLRDRDIPALNMFESGATRLAHDLGRPPDTKADPFPTARGLDQENQQTKADKRVRIVQSYDHRRLERQLRFQARWLPVYAYCVWIITERIDSEGNRYPVREIRNPYTSYPAWWSFDEQVDELVTVRKVPPMTLADLYPDAKSKIEDSAGSFSTLYSADAYSLSRPGIEVLEYHNNDGTWVMMDGGDTLLDRADNPLTTGPKFVIGRRPTVNKMIGQYNNAIGLMSHMAKLNVLALIATEDSVFREALALDTPIPTPDGWTTMGALEIGDVVLGADGLGAEIIEATDTQYHRKIYRVTFADGTHIDASDGHLWEVRIASTRQSNRIYTTSQILDDGRVFRVPKSKPWKLPEAELPIDPYLLGVWLGDGTANNAIITGAEADLTEIETNFARLGYSSKRVATPSDKAPMTYVSNLWTHLKAEGLLGNKHIPVAYLRASIDQRVALLQGLVDSDGCVSKKGYVSFANSNRALIDGATELLRTLGELPGEYERRDSRLRNGVMWELTWTARNVMPARLQRKASRVKMGGPASDWVTITDITEIESVPVRCIAVANNDRLFLAGAGAHATHNTNIVGGLENVKYERGRFAVNYLPPGATVDRPTGDFPAVAFEQINRLERQLRIQTQYPVDQDGQSPLSFATGEGIDRLTASGDKMVGEYRAILAEALEFLDAKSLEWDELMYPDGTKPMHGIDDGEAFFETYTPSTDIMRQWQTRREYGPMAGIDEPTKIVAGLQLLQADVIDLDTFRQMLHNLGQLDKIRDNVRRDRAERGMFDALEFRLANGDATAALVFAEIFKDPDKAATTLVKFFTPEEPQVSPEEEAFLGQGQAPAGPLPDVQTVLSQISQGGSIQGGGVQSVGRIP